MGKEGNASQSWGSTGPGMLLRLIRTADRWTKTELVRESGLARTTLIERLEHLQSAGYVTSNKQPTQTGGRPAETYSFNDQAGYLLVADIGGSHVRVGVTDLAGILLATSERDLNPEDGPDAVLGGVIDDLDGLCRTGKLDPSRIRAIGVGVPGAVHEGVLSRPEISGWESTSVAGCFAQAFPQVPVLVDKDANIMARGEQRQNPEKYQNMLVLKVGMGLGCGIVVDGRILQGAAGAAGSIGHIPRGGNVQCSCGQWGCLEAVASGRSIAKALLDAGQEVHTSRDIVNLVRKRDRQALDLVRQAGRELGEMLGLVAAVMNPSIIIVGGNLAESPEPLLAGIRESIYSHFLPSLTSGLEIRPSVVGSAAGLTGAAELALEALLDPARIDESITLGQSWR
ncbi:ROK family protein [Arthrobacter antibioticus]|uniref:ROK family protein n=1 Tax=Arthrobacter sp. H35-MC1 TaxID=3046203 RepID=UPI0024BBD424|nr:ROK family transcriptional regulator [Arthrobacter sp. H35-MC1]MDJ0318315.1 ROK family protein [Arthrobacter sp. H35-MC1]